MRTIVPGIVKVLQPGDIALRPAAVYAWRFSYIGEQSVRAYVEGLLAHVEGSRGPAVAVYTGGESLGLAAGCWALGVVSIQDWLLWHASSDSKGWRRCLGLPSHASSFFELSFSMCIHPGRSLRPSASIL